MQAVQRGEAPTIETAAKDAGVSRAAAYRYFTSQQPRVLSSAMPETHLRYGLPLAAT